MVPNCIGKFEVSTFFATGSHPVIKLSSESWHDSLIISIAFTIKGKIDRNVYKLFPALPNGFYTDVLLVCTG